MVYAYKIDIYNKAQPDPRMLLPSLALRKLAEVATRLIVELQFELHNASDAVRAPLWNATINCIASLWSGALDPFYGYSILERVCSTSKQAVQ